MTKNIMMIGTKMEKAVVDKAVKQTAKDFGVPVSKMALIRMLIGVYSQGEIELGINDLAKYSPDTLRNRVVEGAEHELA